MEKDIYYTWESLVDETATTRRDKIRREKTNDEKRLNSRIFSICKN